MSKSKVKAGEGYVELGIKSRISAGMKSAGAELKRGGAQLTRLGGVATAAAAGIGAPLIASAKRFADFGDQIDKTSARTSVGAEALSELSFAAEQSGADLGTVEKGLFGMSRSLFDLERGSATVGDAFGKIGLSLADLQGLSVEEQLEKVSDGLAGVTDESTRGAIAQQIFGRAGRQLLPLFSSGADGMRALRAEAKALGITMSKEDAESAAKLTDAMNRVKRTLSAVTLQVGGALAPAMTDLSDKFAAGVTKVVMFVKNNQGLVRAVAMGAAVVGGLGAALVGIGGTLSIVGVAVGGLATVVGALASPLGIAAAAVVGLGVAFFKFTELGGRTIGVLQERFGPLVETVKNAVGQITEALSAGDMAKAWELTASLIEMVWLDVTGELRDAWDGAMDFIFNAGSSTAKAIGQVFQALSGLLDGMLKGYEKTYNNVFGKVADGLTELGGTRVIGGNSGEAGQGAFASTFGGSKQSLESVIGQIDQFGREMERSADAQMGQRREDREAARRARLARLNELRGTFSQPSLTEDLAKPEEKREEPQTKSLDLSGLIARLRDASAGAEGTGDGQPGGSGRGSTGTFSAFGAMVSAGPQTRMLSLTQSIELSTKRSAEGIVRLADLLADNSGTVNAIAGVAQTIGGSAIGGLVTDQATKLLTQLVSNTGRALGYQKKGTVAKFQ